MIQDYNLYMIGVDKLDQLMSYYSFLHKSVKWWRKVFFWVVEVAVVNAYIISKVLAVKRGEKPMSHRAFRRRLIESLSEPIRSTVNSQARHGPRKAQNIKRLRPVRQMGEEEGLPCLQQPPVGRYTTPHTLCVWYLPRQTISLPCRMF